MGSSEQTTVLVVDDDEIKRYTVTRILSKAGFKTIEASTGAGTLEAVSQHPDVVVLDVNLPDMSGFEICRRLKSDPATASIVVLHFSATLTDSADRAVGLEGGADGYLTEPITAAELVATVRSLLRIREAERAANMLAREWRTTFDAISDGVCLLDGNDRVVRCNASMARFANRPVEAIVGMTCAELAGIEPGSETPCSRARASGSRIEDSYEDGERAFSVVADPVVDDLGAITGSVYVVSDVTAARDRERERAELLEREQLARGQAESANRAKDEFLATMSHELRTPLNSMLGWISLMRQGSLEPEQYAHALEVLERNARSQAQIISDILDVSRIITGKIRIDVRDVDPAAVTDAAVDAVRPAAAAKGVEIVTALEPANRVAGDPERLQQVIWNLVANAVKFTPKGGRVSIEVHRVGPFVEIVVSDTGVGIDPAFLPFVFDRFRQADSSSTRAYSGLGLGLSIVRRLVELHGGTTRPASPGRGLGATFTVSLPALDGPVLSSEVLRRGLREAGGGVRRLARLDGLRVLVVDDDADTLAMLGVVLEDCGAEVKGASSATEGLEALSEWIPDVIVSDIGMPNADGHAFIRQVRELTPEAGGMVPAVALTAYAQSEDRMRALEAGFQTYVSKPAEPAELAAVVASLAGRIG